MHPHGKTVRMFFRAGRLCALDIFGNMCYTVTTDNESEVKIMSVITVTNENFASEVIASDKPVLVDFWATWCPPCRMQSPIVDELAVERADIKVGKVNVDEQPELAEKFDVQNIPTLIIFKGGKAVRVLVGLRSKEQLLAEFD